MIGVNALKAKFGTTGAIDTEDFLKENWVTVDVLIKTGLADRSRFYFDSVISLSKLIRRLMSGVFRNGTRNGLLNRGTSKTSGNSSR